tara:strand:+ start:53 stop:493 length:441 start_codon:yes stop_codon:yes gene_type:complete
MPSNDFYTAEIFTQELKKFYAGKFEDVQRKRNGKVVAVRESQDITCKSFCDNYQALCLEYWKAKSDTKKEDAVNFPFMSYMKTEKELMSLVRTRKKTFEEKYLAMWEIHGKDSGDEKPKFGKFKRIGIASPNTKDAYKALKEKMGF